MRLFLPGMDGTASLFPALPSGDRALALPPGRLSYAELAESLLPRVPDGATIVAESFSGPLAVLLASEARVERLVLVASFVISPVLPVPEALLRVVFGARPPAFVLRRVLLDAHAPESLVMAVQRAIHTVPPSVMAHRARSVMEVDVCDALARVDAPITYIQAMRDRVVGRGAADTVMRVRPDAELKRVDGPHLLLQTRWKECLAHL